MGDAILSLKTHGIDEQKHIVSAVAPTPYLFNISSEYVERFRKQVTVIDLVNEGSPDVLRQAVWACYQETPTAFRDYSLCDPGAYPEPPLSGKITWRVMHPEREPINEEARAAEKRLRELMDRIKKSVEDRKPRECSDD